APTVEAAKAQSRTGRMADRVPARSQRFRAKRACRNRIDDEVSEPPKDDAILAIASSPTEPAPARAPGDDGAGAQLARAGRTGIETPGVKRPLGAHAPVRVGSAARLAPFLFGARQPRALPPSPRDSARAVKRSGTPVGGKTRFARVQTAFG